MHAMCDLSLQCASCLYGVYVVRGPDGFRMSGSEGAKRLQAELKYMHKQTAEGLVPHISDIMTVGDDLSKWRFKVKAFDTDCQAGCDLNSDLAQLAAQHGQDYLLMEATFPADYPASPFFLRMVTPRCLWLHCDVYFVQTATGPGGMAGPLRVDLTGRFGRRVMSEYSDMEAQAAFQRMLAHHKRNGW